MKDGIEWNVCRLNMVLCWNKFNINKILDINSKNKNIFYLNY